MTKDILNTILLASSFLFLFGVAEILYHFLKIKVELTRKLVHVGTGLLTMLFPIMLSNHWYVLLLCTSFALILILSFKFNFLKSINAIERESVGSIAYPVSVYGCYLAFNYFNHNYIYFYLPILILAICDPIAALMGKRFPVGKFKIGNEKKTLMGSGMFFISAFSIVAVSFCLWGAKLPIIEFVLQGVFIAIVSAFTEAISRKGYDNITIPASVLLCLMAINNLF